MNPTALVEIGALGMLAEHGPTTTDTVRDRLQHNFGDYWTYGYGALLPAFERLEAEDCIARVGQTRAGEDGHAADGTEGGGVYRVTDRGKDRLETRLEETRIDPENPTELTEFVVKVGFIHHLPPAKRDEQLAAMLDRFRTVREEWVDAVGAHDAGTMDPYDDYGHRLAIIDLTVGITDMVIAWLEDLRAAVPAESTDGNDDRSR